MYNGEVIQSGKLSPSCFLGGFVPHVELRK